MKFAALALLVCVGTASASLRGTSTVYATTASTAAPAFNTPASTAAPASTAPTSAAPTPAETTAPVTAHAVSDATAAAIEDGRALSATRISGEKTGETKTRDSRASSFDQVLTLVTKLEDFIAAEGRRVIQDHRNDVERITGEQTTSKKNAKTTMDDEIRALVDDEAAKRAAMEKADLAQNAAQIVFDDKANDHANKISAAAKAAELFGSASEAAGRTLETAMSDATTSGARQNAAALAQKQADETFLSGTVTFIATLKEKLTQYQTPAQAASASLISLGERMKLRALVANFQRQAATPEVYRYLDAARFHLRADDVNAITAALEAVEKSVKLQQNDVALAYEQHIGDIQKQIDQQETAAQTVHDTTVGIYQSSSKVADAARLAADAAEAFALRTLNAAKAAHQAAQESYTAAQAKRAADTPVIVATYEAAVVKADGIFAEEKAKFDGALTSAQTYLKDESEDLSKVRVAVEKHTTKSPEAVALLLMQMAQRLQRRRLSHLKGKYTYVGDQMSSHLDTKEQLVQFIGQLRQSLMEDMAASDTNKEQSELHAESTHKAMVDAANTENTRRIGVATAATAAAIKIKNTENEKLAGANAALAQATKEAVEATATRAAAEDRLAEEEPILKTTRTNEYAAHLQAYNQNLAIVNAKKDDALRYLGQETATVDKIETLLGALGLGYTFTVGADGVSLLQVEAAKGQKQMSAAQKDALNALVHMANTFDATANVNVQTPVITDGQKKTIKDVLTIVREEIAKEVTKVGVNHGDDMTLIKTEHESADASSLKEYTAAVLRMTNDISSKKLTEAAKIEVQTAANDAQVTQQGISDAADVSHSNAVSHQADETRLANAQASADKAAADTYKSELNTAASKEMTEDTRIIQEELQSLAEIEEALESIDFTAMTTMLIQQGYEYKKDREEGGYITTKDTTKGVKERVLALVDSIEAQVGKEQTRLQVEIEEDKANNDNELARAQREAGEAKTADLGLLKKNRDAAQSGYDSSNGRLAAATASHSAASVVYQKEADDLATALSIEVTNEASYAADFQKTKKVADDLHAEELEMVNNRHSRSVFYLQTHVAGLDSIFKMLSGVDMTTTVTGAKANTAAYATRKAYVNTLRNISFTSRSGKESGRVKTYQNQQVDTTSHARVATDAHTLTNGADTRLVYNHVQPKNQYLEALLQVGASASSVGGDTVGDFINDLKAATSAEKAKVDVDYDGELLKVAGTRSTLLGTAETEQKRLLKIDTDRVVTEQEDRDSAFGNLAKAHAEKTTATTGHAAATVTLNDALATQDQHTPLINTHFEETTAKNKAAHTSSQAAIVQKNTDGNAYLNDELAVLKEVRSAVQKLGITSASMMELVAHLVHMHTKKMGSKYEFTKTVSKSFADKEAVAGQNYMQDGTVNAYSLHKLSIQDMLATTDSTLEAELAHVRDIHSQDTNYLVTTLASELASYKKDYEKTLADLAANTAAKLAAWATATTARKAQELIKVAAEKDHSTKQAQHNADLQAQRESLETETLIKSNKFAAALNEWTTNTSYYAEEQEKAEAMIENEIKMLDEIEKILNEDVAKASSGSVEINDCGALKTTASAAAAKASATTTTCDQARVDALAQGQLFTSASIAACDAVAADAGAASDAGAAYQACLSSQASSLGLLETKEQALTLLNTMAAKYIDSATHNGITASNVASANELLRKLKGLLGEERAGVQTQVAADHEKAAEVRLGYETAATAQFVAAEAFHKGVVATSKEIMNAAFAVMGAETAKWQGLVDVEAGKKGEHEAAEVKEATEGQEALDLKVEEDLGANGRFTSQTTKIAAILENDVKYLMDERAAIKELQGLLAQLNLGLNGGASTAGTGSR